MRRTDREIQSRQAIDEIIAGAEVCRLGLSQAGKPYIVPVSFGYDGACIYFHTASQGMKIDYMTANPQVCFEMEQDVRIIRNEESACKWGHSFYSVIGFGKVQEVTEEHGKIAAFHQIMRHYSGQEWEYDPAELAKTRLWCIPIDQVTGKHR
jgi:uncharacterized protein